MSQNTTKQDTGSTSSKAAPDLDYSDPDAVYHLGGYDRKREVRQKTSDFSPGDEVQINDRVRSLEVIPQDETNLPEMAYQETFFLKGNGTEYRIRVDEGSYPMLDRGPFTDDEYVAFLSVEGGE